MLRATTALASDSRPRRVCAALSLRRRSVVARAAQNPRISPGQAAVAPVARRSPCRPLALGECSGRAYADSRAGGIRYLTPDWGRGFCFGARELSCSPFLFARARSQVIAAATLPQGRVHDAALGDCAPSRAVALPAREQALALRRLRVVSRRSAGASPAGARHRGRASPAALDPHGERRVLLSHEVANPRARGRGGSAGAQKTLEHPALERTTDRARREPRADGERDGTLERSAAQ